MIDATQISVSSTTAAAERPGERGRGSRDVIRFVVIALVVIAVGAWFVRRYYPFLEDDSLISVQYASRFLHGHGLTWSVGRPVEGYSNLLWVLSIAFLGAFGVDLVVALRVLGILGMAVAALAAMWWFRPGRVGSLLPMLATGLAFACSGSVAVWAVGGLEQPLLVALVALGAVQVLTMLYTSRPARSALLMTGLCFGLAALTRPDGLLFGVVAGAMLLAVGRFRRDAWRNAALLFAIPIALVAGQVLFRVLYYGDVVPNSAYAKVVLTPARLQAGYRYVRDGLWPMVGLMVPALAAIVVRWRSQCRRVSYLALSLMSWLAYVVFIGGDIFPGRRHLVVGVWFAAVLAGECWSWFAVRPTRTWRVAGWFLAGLSVALLAYGQTTWDPQVTAARSERWEYDCKAAARTLRQAYAPAQPLTAVTAAGCMPYFSGFPSLDLLGLNDWHMGHHRPASMGTGYLGHELGDPTYVLSKTPDLVIPCSPYGSRTGCFYGDASVVAQPGFRSAYTLVPMRVRQPSGGAFYALIWLRTASPIVGVQTRNNTITIPGPLFGTPGAAPPPGCEAAFGCFGAGEILVSSGPSGALVAEIPTGRTATFRGLRMPAGTWRIDVDASGPTTISVTGGTPGTEPGVIALASATEVDVAVTSVGPAARLSSVRLTRLS